MSKQKRPKSCPADKTIEECELDILHLAIAKAEQKKKEQGTNVPEIKKIMNIVEDFLRHKKRIVYGGTAQNNILPPKDQFYDPVADIPDYDFFSPDAINDAKELADIYAKAGYVEIEAKSGVHAGTYKLFVNFIPTADITQMPDTIYNVLKREALEIDGIYYSPPNFLRMGMYLELSRPDGDVSRWEKVFKRLTLLNKHYPLTAEECAHIDFQRPMEMDMSSVSASRSKSKSASKSKSLSKRSEESEKEKEISNEDIYDNVLNTFVSQDVVFFGGYAISKYAKYMPTKVQRQVKKIPDFDVLSEETEKTAELAKKNLETMGCTRVSIHKYEPIGEIVPMHYEIRVDKDTVAFIYQPNACHSYNVMKEGGKEIRIATIDTMLSYYLAFLYVDQDYYDVNRILCMSKYLFEVQAKNRLSHRGLLKRFSIQCMGHQETLEEIRQHKSQMFKKLSKHPQSKEYKEMFFKYRPPIKSTEPKSPKTKEANKDIRQSHHNQPKQYQHRQHNVYYAKKDDGNTRKKNRNKNKKKWKNKTQKTHLNN